MRGQTTTDATSGRKAIDSARGQTTIDFAMGISVFLLSVAVAFTLLPSIFVPFNAPIDDDLTTRADRVAATAIADLSTGGNALDPDRTADRFNRTRDAFRSSFGLSATTNVNVTITNPETGTVARLSVDGDDQQLRAGAVRGNHPTAASSRIVTIGDDAYQLTVYLW